MKVSFILALLLYSFVLYGKQDETVSYSLQQALKNPESVRYLYLGPETFSISPDIGKLINLEKLWLMQANVDTLPAEFFNLPNVNEVVLKGTPNIVLQKLFKGLAGIESLRSLQIINVPITDMPDNLQNLISLESLSFVNNGLSSLPPSLSALVNLRSLDISKNHITSLPDGFSDLTELRSLAYNENGLTQLPDVISLMLKLRKITLIKNYNLDLKETFNTLDPLPELNYLSLEGCHITEIPEDCSLPESLGELHLEVNFFKKIGPNDINLFSTVKKLYLDYNSINKICNGIGTLHQLELLSLEGNKLQKLPEAFEDLSETLLYLNLYDNSLSEDQMDIIRKMLPQTKINF